MQEGHHTSNSSKDGTSHRRVWDAKYMRRYSWLLNGPKMPMMFDEENRPLESHAILETQLRMLAQDGFLAPLDYYEWKWVPQRYKDDIWSEIQAYTQPRAEDWMYDCFMDFVGREWQNWKNELKKKYYEKYDNDADRLIYKPEKVDNMQWRSLVYYWSVGSKQEKVETDALSSVTESVEGSHTMEDAYPANEALDVILGILSETQTMQDGSSSLSYVADDDTRVNSDRPAALPPHPLGYYVETIKRIKKALMLLGINVDAFQDDEVSETPSVTHRTLRSMDSRIHKIRRVLLRMGIDIDTIPLDDEDENKDEPSTGSSGIDYATSDFEYKP